MRSTVSRTSATAADSTSLWTANTRARALQVIISVAEHHANIVPWQLVCEATGATLRHIGLNANQELDLADLRAQMSSNTKLVALVHASNVLGSVLPTAEVAELARQHGAKLLLDCCQSVPHMPVDVQARAPSLPCM